MRWSIPAPVSAAMSSASGSADVLEALGIPIDLQPADAAAALKRDGFAFLFAPAYHPAMKHAGPTRRELGVPTAFNLIGPLTNPAGVRRQVVGVADPQAARRVAYVLHRLGAERAFVVHGHGLDELPLDGSGVIHDVSMSGVRRRRVDSVALGLAAEVFHELRHLLRRLADALRCLVGVDVQGVVLAELAKHALPLVDAAHQAFRGLAGAAEGRRHLVELLRDRIHPLHRLLELGPGGGLLQALRAGAQVGGELLELTALLRDHRAHVLEQRVQLDASRLDAPHGRVGKQRLDAGQGLVGRARKVVDLVELV